MEADSGIMLMGADGMLRFGNAETSLNVGHRSLSPSLHAGDLQMYLSTVTILPYNFIKFLTHNAWRGSVIIP